MKTLTIAGYNKSNLTLSRNGNGVDIYTTMVSKAKGKKAYHATVQVWANGTVKVFTIESLKNIEQKDFILN